MYHCDTSLSMYRCRSLRLYSLRPHCFRGSHFRLLRRLSHCLHMRLLCRFHRFHRFFLMQPNLLSSLSRMFPGLSDYLLFLLLLLLFRLQILAGLRANLVTVQHCPGELCLLSLQMLSKYLIYLLPQNEFYLR